MISVESIVLFLTIAAGVLGSSVYAASAIAYARAGRRPFRSLDTDVTVIVAAHDEEDHLPGLIGGLKNQTYPRDRFRIVLADDRSSDRTGRLAMEAAAAGLDIRVVRIDSVPDGVSPKKHALDAAIAGANTDWLLFTDADCRPEPDWIRHMSGRFADADVVIGISPLASRHFFVDAWVRHESARTALLSIGAAVAGRPYMAVGRNWAYRKSLYARTGGLRPLFTFLGGDDDLLLQRFVRLGANIAVCTDPGARCPSDVPDSIMALMRQKLRHFSASRAYTIGAKAALAALHVAQFVALVAGPCALLALGVSPVPVLALMAVKLTADALCVATAASAPSPARKLLGIPMEWTYTAASATLGLFAQWTKPRW